MGKLVECLLKAGHQVFWLVAPIDADNPDVCRLAQMGAHVEALPEWSPNFIRLKKIRKRLRSFCLGQPLLFDKVHAFNPDHVFVNQGATWCALQPDLFEVLEAWQRRYSLICHLGQADGFPKGISQQKGRQLMRQAKRVYFNSRWTQRMAEEQIDEKINNSKSFQLPLRFAISQALEWPACDRPRIGMVNRIDIYHKGLDLAVEAAAVLKKQGIQFGITIVGRGGDEDKLRNLIQDHGLENEVKMEPYTENLEEFWRRHEILLLPSRYEGLAVSMLEAMGFGRPVLRTPYGGAEEWMEDGINGYLCPAPEVPLLCATMRRALAERDRWEEMGRRAHEKVKACLDPNPARVFLESLR